MTLLSGAMSLGLTVPYLEGIAVAGGSAQVIFEIIDTVRIFKIIYIYFRIIPR